MKQLNWKDYPRFSTARASPGVGGTYHINRSGPHSNDIVPTMTELDRFAVMYCTVRRIGNQNPLGSWSSLVEAKRAAEVDNDQRRTACAERQPGQKPSDKSVA